MIMQRRGKQNSKRMRFSNDSLKLLLESHLKRRRREREKQAELYTSFVSSSSIIL